jgi:hypothetical protein
MIVDLLGQLHASNLIIITINAMARVGHGSG